MTKEPNVYSFADECYVYYGDYKKDLEQKDKEIDRLNNIIDELEKYLDESKKYGSLVYSEIKEDGSFEEFIKLEEIKNKLKSLKEGK